MITPSGGLVESSESIIGPSGALLPLQKFSLANALFAWLISRFAWRIFSFAWRMRKIRLANRVSPG